MKTKCFLQLKPEIMSSGTVRGAKVVGVTQKQPRTLDDYAVAVEIEIDFSASIFDAAKANITLTETTTVVTASHPEDETA